MTLKDTPEFTEYMRERREKAKADALNAKKELKRQKAKEYYQKHIKKNPPKLYFDSGESKDNK